MESPKLNLTIILPCYQSEIFIKQSFSILENLLEQHSNYRLLFVDDGSKDRTGEILQSQQSRSLFSERIDVLRLHNNLGKGGAICEGAKLVKTEVLCFTDADLAYFPENISSFYETLLPGSVVIANRVHPKTICEISPQLFRFIATRHLASRLFNCLTRIFLVPGIRDVQAGMKMFISKDFLRLIPYITQFRFSFDLELLTIARRQKMGIINHPVHYRYLIENSTVHFIRDSFILLTSILKISIRLWAGRYSP
jgi:glycosyltransferase involved in cell wall biosynthesis